MFGAGTLVPTLVLGITLLWQFAVREQASLEQQAHIATAEIVSDLDRDLTAETAVLRTLAASPTLQGRDFDRFRALAEEAARVLDVNVVVRDIQGARVFDTHSGGLRPQDGLVDVHRRALASDRPVFSGIYVGEDRQPIVSAYVSVLQEGRPTLLLGLERQAGRVRDVLLQSSLPGGWRSSVADSEHLIIARAVMQETFVARSIAPDFAAHLGGDSGVWRGRNLEGIEMVSAYSRSRLSGWYALVGIPAQILETPLRSAIGVIVAVATLGGALALVLAWLVGRRIEVPMRSLVRAAGALGRGEAIPPIATPLREANEIGRAFQDAAQLLLQRQGALDRSLKRTTEVLESIGDGFYAIDGEWRFTYVNHRALELLGMTSEQLLGRPLLEMFPHLVGGETEAVYREATANGKPREFETMSLLLGRWLSVSVYPQAGGGLSVYFRDVSAQRAAAAALRASEERLRLAQEAGGIGTWEIQPESGLLVWSTGLYRLIGLDPVTTPPSHEAYLAIVHPEDRPRVLALAQQASAASGSYAAEYRIVRASDGAVRWLASRGIVSRGAGGPTRVLGVVTDVTERRAAMDALTRVQELQSELIHVGRLTEMGQMAAALAHELNQPLAGILNYVQATRRMLRRGDVTGSAIEPILEKAAAPTQRA
ncbi:MAG TPA: PAS domain S-box protein, partial [Stellaceae bacterium]|nr:PAS domain S-box protein [Stellaceae bacterium]